MNKKKINEALRMIGEGFIALSEAYGVEDTTVAEVKEVVTSKEEILPTVEEVVENTPTMSQKEVLEAMTYLELKSKAKELGLKAIGSKKAIMESILELNSTEEKVDEEPVEEVVEESQPETEEIEISEEEDIEVEDEEEDIEFDEEVTEEEINEIDTHTLYDQVVADLEEYTNEELADILSEIGISPKGKRQALLAKIVQAIEEGKLEWEDEESEEETPTEAVQEPEEVEEEESEVTFIGSTTRLTVIQDYIEKLESDFEEGDINDKTILKFLKSYYNDKYTSCGRQADFEEYARIQCELVDDEGELHSLEEPYFVADEVYCCGEILKEVDNDLYCEHCGTTYENDNE